MMFNNRWRKVPAQKNAFREKLILAEYDFQRREFHAVHSPTLLGGALAVNVAIGVYIFNQREILLKFIASGQDFWYILIYCYGFLFLFAFFSAIRSAIMGGFTLQRFAIEKEYDKILAELSRGIEGDPQSRSEILDQAELQTFVLLEKRIAQLRRRNTGRRGSLRIANTYFQLSLIFGAVLLVATFWPRSNDGTPKSMEEVFPKHQTTE